MLKKSIKSFLMFIWNHLMNLNIRKRTFLHVRPVKIQMSVRILALSSESSLGAFG